MFESESAQMPPPHLLEPVYHSTEAWFSHLESRECSSLKSLWYFHCVPNWTVLLYPKLAGVRLNLLFLVSASQESWQTGCPQLWIEYLGLHVLLNWRLPPLSSSPRLAMLRLLAFSFCQSQSQWLSRPRSVVSVMVSYSHVHSKLDLFLIHLPLDP